MWSRLFNTGVQDSFSTSRKQAIFITNIMSLIFSMAAIVVIFLTWLIYDLKPTGTIVYHPLVLIIPFFLNYLGHTTASRIILSWSVASLAITNSIYSKVHGIDINTATFVAPRITMIVSTVVPVILFSLKRKWAFFIGLSVPLVLILGFDFIHTLFGVGYTQVGLNEPNYYPINLRVLVSLVIAVGGAFLLKFNVLKNEEEKDRLIQQLSVQAEESRLIKYSLNVVTDAIYWIKNDFSIVDVNKAAQEFLGYTKEEFLKMKVTDFDPDYVDVDSREFFENLCRHGSLKFETRHRTRTGQIFPVEIVANYVKFDDVEYSCAVVRDISERIIERKRLEDSEKKHRTMFEVMKSGVVYQAKDGSIIDANKSAQEILGLTLDQMQGRTSMDPRWHSIKEDGSPFNGNEHPAMKALATGEVSFDTLMGVFNPSSETYRWISIQAVPLIDPVDNKPNMVYTIFDDVTEKRKAAEEILQAKAQAEAASVAKSEFLANMSHEIRTPLNGIIGFTDLIQKTKLTADQRTFTRTIEQSAQSLMNIINDILDFSKIEAGKLDLVIEKTDIRELCVRVTNLITYQAQEKNLTISIHIADNVPDYIYVDDIRITQILLNLLSNAIKFTEKGKVELSITTLSLTDETCELRMSVKDTGIGIKQENQSKIFDVFTQADSSTTKKFGGTGLGLAISNKLLEKMNSSMSLISSYGHGSTFYFDILVKCSKEKNDARNILPLDGNLKISTTNGETTISMNSQGITILIAEDNPVNMLLAKSILQNILPDANIIEAENGQIAVDKFQTEKPDMIFMDIRMPEKNGYEASLAIRKLETETYIPIIALTAGTAVGERERCIEAGMDDYLSKPVIQDSIQKMIAKWLKVNTQKNSEQLSVLTKDDHFNKLELLDRVGGKEEMLTKILTASKKSIDNCLADLKAHVSSNNQLLLSETAHKLKGVALSSCFTLLATKASQLEELETDNYHTANQLVSEIEAEINLIKSLLP